MRDLQAFWGGDAHRTLGNLRTVLKREVDALDNQYVLKASPTELAEYYTSEGLVDTLALHPELMCNEGERGIGIDVVNPFMYGNLNGGRVEVRGTELAIGIPFDGDPMLLKMTLASYPRPNHPDTSFVEGCILLHVRFHDGGPSAEELRKEIDHRVLRLTGLAAGLNSDLGRHNFLVREGVPEWLAAKRKTAETTVGTVRALGLPVRSRDQALTASVPVQRKKLVLSRPSVAKGAFKPEPVLEEAVYEEVLKSLRSMSLVIERNRSSFQRLDEEQVRDHFLINLNNLFEGQATGETFNAAGKTDILIRVDDRTVFIGECKMWSGSSDFGKAIDQLLSYLTWRDCKCALLVFNKNKDSAGVSAKMHDEMTKRKEFRRTVANDPVEGGRYVLVKQDEPGREIIVSTLVFDIQQKP